MKPEYMAAHEAKEAERKAAAATAPVTSGPTLEKDTAERLLSYFIEDGDAGALAKEWKAMKLPKNDGGAGFLMAVGFEHPGKAEKAAAATAALLERGAVAFAQVSAGLATHVECLEDLLVDVPKADRFYHLLMARLLVSSAWESSILSIAPKLPREMAAKLLVGALKEAANL